MSAAFTTLGGVDGRRSLAELLADARERARRRFRHATKGDVAGSKRAALLARQREELSEHVTLAEWVRLSAADKERIATAFVDEWMRLARRN